jgi:hypothetical protein
MKQVIFYTKNADQEREVGRVWNDNGALRGTVNEIFLNDLKDWLIRSGEPIEDYLESLHQRFDGDFLYAGLYQEV